MLGVCAIVVFFFVIGVLTSTEETHTGRQSERSVPTHF